MATVELTPSQSVVLGLIKYHKCISPLEMTYRCTLNLRSIEDAIPFLIQHRLAYLSSSGGYPKRYVPRPEPKKRKTYLDENGCDDSE